MHLIEEQHATAAAFGAHYTRALDGLTDVLDSGHHGGKLHELCVRLARDEAREGGLAGTRRPPEDQRVQLPLFERTAQWFAGPDDLVLADKLVERARAHAVGKRTQRIVDGRVAQKVRLAGSGARRAGARTH